MNKNKHYSFLKTNLQASVNIGKEAAITTHLEPPRCVFYLMKWDQSNLVLVRTDLVICVWVCGVCGYSRDGGCKAHTNLPLAELELRSLGPQAGRLPIKPPLLYIPFLAF